jgi:hypothetical protein
MIYGRRCNKRASSPQPHCLFLPLIFVCFVEMDRITSSGLDKASVDVMDRLCLRETEEAGATKRALAPENTQETCPLLTTIMGLLSYFSSSSSNSVSPAAGPSEITPPAPVPVDHTPASAIAAPPAASDAPAAPPRPRKKKAKKAELDPNAPYYILGFAGVRCHRPGPKCGP